MGQFSNVTEKQPLLPGDNSDRSNRVTKSGIRHSDILVNAATDDEFLPVGYNRNVNYTIIFYILGIFSVGFIFLLGYWYPVRRLKFTHQKCCLKEATSVLLVETSGQQYFVSKVEKMTQHPLNIGNDFVGIEKDILSQREIKYFTHKFLRYYFNSDCDQITALSGLDISLTVKAIYSLSHGITKVSRGKKLLIHGENYINVPVRAFPLILFQLALNPFYIFQAVSVTLWYNDNYQYFATLIVVMTLVSLILNTYETYTHLQKLRSMVGHFSDVQILQNCDSDGEVIKKSSHDLVPGDVLVIPPEGMKLPCDAVLLNGRCVVNESTLTGESFPTTKTALDSITSSTDVMLEMYSVDKHKRHTLYNGTEILQGRFDYGDKRILAVVMRTGFCTLKGRLIRSIIHPKPIHFTFFKDSIKFILFLFGLAFIGSIYSIVVFIQQHEPVLVIIRKCLGVFTIVVPPSLPACMSVGLMYALHRLRKKQIYCIDPARVNLCGKIKLFVFDKTGTLTKDELAVSGVIRTNGERTEYFDNDIKELTGEDILKGMATCHSLTTIKAQVVGDPLDVYMFNFSGWTLHQQSDETALQVVLPPGSESKDVNNTFKPEEPRVGLESEITILKQYPFESSLQRMSVITNELHAKHMKAYVKGSPEMILSMCKRESIPNDIHDTLEVFTKTGCRVLALASKEMTDVKDVKDIQRSHVECNLSLLGLIIFENVVKEASMNVIQTLYSANIRTIMATGDNLFTAVSVAKQVDIIKGYQKVVELDINDSDVLRYKELVDTHIEKTTTSNEISLTMEYNSLHYTLVLSGSTYMRVRELYPDLLPNVLLAGSVFARMSPNQKSTLVEDLKSIGYGVGMCGDGANDCGALKAAHAGIALSDTEASVAAPFTSKVFDISCVPQLIQEGRAALVTSFGIFKYMALYSFVQFMGVLILYSVRSNYSDFQFLYADLILTLVLCFTMIQSEANPKLTRKCPPGSLVHPIFIGGIFLQVIVQFLFQFGAFLYVPHMSWYKPPAAFTENEGKYFFFTCYENTSVMIISFFQYVWLSAVCASGEPYRIPLYKNWKYVLAFFLTTSLNIVIVFYQDGPVRSLLLFAKVPSTIFCASLLMISVGNFYVSYLIEKVLLVSKFAKNLGRRIQRKTEPKNQYKRIYSHLKKNSNWPSEMCKME